MIEFYEASVATSEPWAVCRQHIAGLAIGQVLEDQDGRLQTYFGGASIEHLTPYDTVAMRDDAIAVEMYTIDGRTDWDYARVTVTPPAFYRSGTEKAIALRTGATDPRTLIERTPVQQFNSRRTFIDVPLSGRARWLSVSPDGKMSSGLFCDRQPAPVRKPAVVLGRGWSFMWLVEGSRPFSFGELCSPRFIDAGDDCPVGEEGIQELETAEQQAALPEDFKRLLDYWTSGEHLRVRARGL